MIATKEKYIAALLKIRDKGKIRNTKFLAMIRAQYSSENHTITATQLAESVGYKSYSAANLQYGTLGHEMADALDYVPPSRKDGRPMWFWSISSGKDVSTTKVDGQYEFIMRPEFVEALEEIKWVK